MHINILTAAAGAAPQTNFGFTEAVKQGGAITVVILIVLGIMSVGSFYILITKLLEQNRILKQYRDIRSGAFWRANTLTEGAAKLEKNGAWRQLVDDGLTAESQHGKMADSLEAHDWLHGSLARSEASINARLAGGLPFLATTGATAPFVGLLGTVIGVYRALIGIAIAGSASMDKVAGPVGEALIMTALGLLVAVPAVFAYNWLQNRNKRIAELLAGFSTDLLANINSRGTVKPALATASKGPGAATRPVGSTTAGQAGGANPGAGTTGGTAPR
jgi:biopolymer transport protein ExbB